MKVILLQDLKELGKEGDAVKVKDGYARNYLFPRKLATPHNAQTLKSLEVKKKKTELLLKKEKAKAEELAKTLSQLSLTISMESGAEDKLFGSITPENIFQALNQEGIHIDKKSITIAEPINKLGVYNVEVKLHPGVKQSLRVWVVKK
ncbi:MAG: 50S ribosomal protein L9 [Candidatus Omnitrophica bacterium]|nr:50S ribosomal protein L9 [Candidatus Omnitrophota bacterium]